MAKRLATNSADGECAADSQLDVVGQYGRSQAADDRPPDDIRPKGARADSNRAAVGRRNGIEMAHVDDESAVTLRLAAGCVALAARDDVEPGRPRVLDCGNDIVDVGSAQHGGRTARHHSPEVATI